MKPAIRGQRKDVKVEKEKKRQWEEMKLQEFASLKRAECDRPSYFPILMHFNEFSISNDMIKLAHLSRVNATPWHLAVVSWAAARKLPER